MTKPYAEVIGDPIEHSKSPLIHNHWLKLAGIVAEYRAELVTPESLADYIAARREDPDWRGCNVTMPHKQAIPELLDKVSKQASKIGAVNTVVREGDGSLTGHNTDVGGFLEPLTDLLEQRQLFRMARIIGTGGAARAVVAALADQGFTLVVAGRNPDKGRSMLKALTKDGEHHAVHLAHFADPTDFEFDDREGCLDLVINASPLGMRNQPELFFDWSHAPPGAIAYDIVTDPLDTPFLQRARDAGHDSIDGLHMLIGQAALAYEHFFGAAPPRDQDDTLRQELTA